MLRHYVLSIRYDEPEPEPTVYTLVADGADLAIEGGVVDLDVVPAPGDLPVWRGNEPAGMTALHDEAIGDWGTIPTSNDAPIPNSGVNIVGNVSDTTYTRVGNQNPPRGAPYAVEVFIPDGMASGQGGAAVYAVLPDREVVYVCCYHKIPEDFQENSVSSKLFRFTFSGGDILVQLNRFENYFESMNFGTPLAGVVSRGDIITGDWVLCEILLNREEGRISTWLDGVPVTVNASVSTGSGPSSVWFDSTWGGSTSAKSGDDRRWFSDFYISGGDA